MTDTTQAAYYALLGAIAGAGYGTFGYVKEVREDPEVSFSFRKFIPDVAIAAIAGASVGMSNMAMPSQAGINEGITMLISLGAAKYIRKAIHAIWPEKK